MVYTVIEVFAGAGGLALGLEKAGLKSKLLVELDKDAVATLQFNRPQWNVVKADVSTTSFIGIDADVVVGGFPCQPFSTAGKKLGFEDVRGTLFYEFARCVKEVQPRLFLAENVKGLINHNKGETLKTMRSVLRDLGYTLQYRLLNTVNFNVPQRRERLVIVGTRSDIQFQFPTPCAQTLTLKDALKNVPTSDGAKYSQNKFKILQLVPSGGNWKDLPEEIRKEYMKTTYYAEGGRSGIARRLSWDLPCPTLMTSPEQKLTERCHPEQTRPLTVREYARVQTFPDDWEFIGSLASMYKQIGNAVPVEFARRLGCQIVKALS